MSDNKNPEEKTVQTQEAQKEQSAAKPKLPASARKPGQNYSSVKFKK